MKCKNYTKDIDLRVSSTKNGKAMMQYVVVKNQSLLKIKKHLGTLYKKQRKNSKT